MAGFEQIEALDKVCIDENVTSGRSCSALMLTTSISGYSPTPAAWIARWLCIHAVRLVMGGACLGSLFAAGGRLAAPHLLQLKCQATHKCFPACLCMFLAISGTSHGRAHARCRFSVFAVVSEHHTHGF